LLLLAACALVMLIVCANAANLLLSQAMERRRELALRITLGASRSRLLRQLLTEASIVAIAGAALGLVATIWLARSLSWLVPTFASPNLISPHVDGGVLALTLFLVAAVTLLAGIAPAVYGSRESFVEELRGGRGAIGGTFATRARGILVTTEMALAIVSLVGAGLFYESFRHSRSVAPGFDTQNVAMSSVSVTLAGYDSARAEGFLNEVADRIRQQPGVSTVSYADYVPLSLGSGSWEDLSVEGYTPEPGENMKLYRAAIGPDYFKVLGIPLVAGRDFTLGDDSAHARAMIVNETFVKQYLSGRATLGVRVRGWGKWFTIVGVVKDSKTFRLTETPTPYFYVPVRQVYRPEMGYTFLVRSSGAVEHVVGSIGAVVRSVDPTVPVYNAMKLATYVDAPMQSHQAATQLLGVLAVISSILAAIGLYGVISYAISQRTKEIGVRIALGAQWGDVLKVVARQAGWLLVGGLFIGFAFAAVTAKLVASMLYGVGAADVTVFAFAGGAMVLVSVAAISVPARRAMMVDPLSALRAE